MLLFVFIIWLYLIVHWNVVLIQLLIKCFSLRLKNLNAVGFFKGSINSGYNVDISSVFGGSRYSQIKNVQINT